MARESVKAFANVRSGWMCAWCDIEHRYVHNAAGSFNVFNYLHHMECCNILEKAAQMATEHPEDGDGYERRNSWHVGEMSIHKMRGNQISMIINNCRVLFHGDAAQALAIVKATRDAQIRSDKKYEKEMATWPQ